MVSLKGFLNGFSKEDDRKKMKRIGVLDSFKVFPLKCLAFFPDFQFSALFLFFLLQQHGPRREWVEESCSIDREVGSTSNYLSFHKLCSSKVAN